MSAPARRASRRRSASTWVPRPTGTGVAMTSTTPPTVSPARLAASICSTMARLVAGSVQRTGSALRRSSSSGAGRGISSSRAIAPTRTTWLTRRVPATCSSSASATAPRATRAAVWRAEARSSTGRASGRSYLSMPARSAWPGRGRVSGRLRAISRSSPAPASTRRSAGSTGSALMTVDQAGHSELRMRMATGPPMVRPWRIPPRTETSSASKAWRAPRPWPSLRRARAARIASVVISTPAGTPSMRAVRASPWDSPAVIHRSMAPILPQARGPPRERPARGPRRPGRARRGRAGRARPGRRPGRRAWGPAGGGARS